MGMPSNRSLLLRMLSFFQRRNELSWTFTSTISRNSPHFSKSTYSHQLTDTQTHAHFYKILYYQPKWEQSREKVQTRIKHRNGNPCALLIHFPVFTVCARTICSHCVCSVLHAITSDSLWDEIKYVCRRETTACRLTKCMEKLLELILQKNTRHGKSSGEEFRKKNRFFSALSSKSIFPCEKCLYFDGSGWQVAI